MKKLTPTQRTILENLREGRDPITGNFQHRPKFFGAYGGWARSFDSLHKLGLMETERVSGSQGRIYRWKLTDKGAAVLEAGGFA